MEFQALSIIGASKLRLCTFFLRGLLRPCKVFHFLVVLSYTIFAVASCGSCITEGIRTLVENEPCRLYAEDSDKGMGDMGLDSKRPQTRLDIEGVCTDFHSFCFPSTLPGLLAKAEASDPDVYSGQSHVGLRTKSAQDGILQNNESRSSVYSMFQMIERGIISCFVSTRDVIDDFISIQRSDSTDQLDLSSCKGSLFNQKSASVRQVPQSDSSFCAVPSLVDISPTVLDWGERSLYHPSVASLTVSNKCNNCILHLYEPFSTDSQFYPCNFSEAFLGPGEVASISFMFWPRWLGLSSAHLILQTSFGGFLVQAKGFVIECPYQIQPLLGLDISLSGRWSGNFSLFNPFDEILYVEEVTAWISASQGDTSHFVEATCIVESIKGLEGPGLPSLKDQMVVNGGQLGKPFLSIKPSREWNIEPHDCENIADIDVSANFYEGRITGAFCVKLLRSSQDKPDTIMVPLEAKFEGKATYNDLSGFVSASLEPLIDNGIVFVTINLRNSAPHILSVHKIFESSGTGTIQVKHIEGLLLFPGIMTRVAVITCSHLHVQLHDSEESENLQEKCKLLILTNDTSGSQIEVPCQDIIELCSSHWDGSSVGDGQLIQKIKISNMRTGFMGNPMQLLPEIRALEGAIADELVLRNWKTQCTSSGMSVLDEHEIVFPVVEVGSHCSRWISIKNPSDNPVVVQLILNSGEIVDECRGSDGFLQPPSGGLVLSESTMPRKFGFSIADIALTEAYVPSHGRASLGPIYFNPSSRCGWKGSVLIRNNLSGVEWLTLRGSGGSLSLILFEGSEPIHSIEFNLDLPSSQNNSSPQILSHMDGTACACSQRFMREINAKNTGDLPLAVRRIKISGRGCGLNGFLVHDCNSFSLEPGETRKLLISYESDYSAAIVHRDLELVLGTGMLVVPIKASIPVYMVSNCRKLMFWLRLKRFFAILLLASLIFVVFGWILPHAISLSSLDNIYTSENGCITTSRRRAGKTFSLQQDGKFLLSSQNNSELRPDGEGLTSVGKYAAGEKVKLKGLNVRNEELTVKNDKPTDWPGAEMDRTVSSESLVIENSNLGCQTNSLSVKTGNEIGRRRRKKKGGSAKMCLFEVSSSQSSNSTPSSPLSPVTSGTPKCTWPTSPSVDLSREGRSPFTQRADQQRCNVQLFESAETSVLEPPVSSKKCYNKLLSSVKEQPSASRKTGLNRLLSSSSSFPSASRPAPSVPWSHQISSSSAIAPSARAPGSRLLMQKASQAEEKASPRDKYTYDIWGDHFSALHLMDKSKDVPSMIPSSVENNSDSFFLRGPQTLVAKPQSTSVSSSDQ